MRVHGYIDRAVHLVIAKRAKIRAQQFLFRGRGMGDDILEDLTKAIRSVKVRIPLAENTRAWIRNRNRD